jgi:stage V sporulation protein D (sporulation-specific penicillin-binding protein)
MAKGYDHRLRILSLCIIAFSLLLIAKLYFVQIVAGETYRERAENQYVAGANYFDRGSIFFSTKEGTLVPAATVRTGYILAINPTILQNRADIEEVYEKITEIFPISRDEFLAKAKKPNDPYEELGRRLNTELAEKIRGLSIAGVSVYKEKWRVYPGGKMAAHAVGFIGFSENELAGRYGLERQHESALGRTGDEAFVNFFVEMFSNVKKSISPHESLEGNVVTHIEPSVQAFLEAELLEVREKYSSEFSGGIVINPKTGAIYALAQDPTFDPNSPQKERSSAIFRNKFLEDRYEMGSVIKALTLAAAIDAGAVNSRSTYYDPGCMTLNTKTFCNYDGKSHGSAVTMQTVLSKSLNTGVAYAVKKMGNEKFAEYMFKFGLDSITGIDLPNEGKSLVSNLRTKRDLEFAQASFGQGIALTPIVTVRALAALANGGTLITPHLTKEIQHKLGTTKGVKHAVGESVISAETSEEISRMLTYSVDHVLRDGKVRLDNHSVAAKTGTAQIARASGGGYYEDKYLHSFFGYFPSYDPQFLIFLYSYDPKNIRYASETLTDPFINTTRFIINYYNIPPDREGPPATSPSIRRETDTTIVPPPATVGSPPVPEDGPGAIIEGGE